jgi:hypothetical protein
VWYRRQASCAPERVTGDVRITLGRIGDYDVDVLLDPPAGKTAARPLAIMVSPWILNHLALYARALWSRQ